MLKILTQFCLQYLVNVPLCLFFLISARPQQRDNILYLWVKAFQLLWQKPAKVSMLLHLRCVVLCGLDFNQLLLSDVESSYWCRCVDTNPLIRFMSRYLLTSVAHKTPKGKLWRVRLICYYAKRPTVGLMILWWLFNLGTHTLWHVGTINNVTSMNSCFYIVSCKGYAAKHIRLLLQKVWDLIYPKQHMLSDLTTLLSLHCMFLIQTVTYDIYKTHYFIRGLICHRSGQHLFM